MTTDFCSGERWYQWKKKENDGAGEYESVMEMITVCWKRKKSQGKNFGEIQENWERVFQKTNTIAKQWIGNVPPLYRKHRCVTTSDSSQLQVLRMVAGAWNKKLHKI